jgi:hypothetical protein
MSFIPVTSSVHTYPPLRPGGIFVDDPVVIWLQFVEVRNVLDPFLNTVRWPGARLVSNA